MFDWLLFSSAALIGGIGGGLALTLRQGGPSPRFLARDYAGLQAWAEEHDWRAYHGSDLERADAVTRVVGLTGEPGDWRLTEGALRSRYGDDDAPFAWQASAILERTTAAGRMVLIGCWRPGRREFRTFASVELSARLSPFTADLEDGELHATGHAPFSAGAAERALTPLPRPSRLRVLGGLMLLSAPLRLSGSVAEDVAARLFGLCRTLPACPGLHPMR